MNQELHKTKVIKIQPDSVYAWVNGVGQGYLWVTICTVCSKTTFTRSWARAVQAGLFHAERSYYW